MNHGSSSASDVIETPCEIELKLRVSSAQARRLAAQPALAAVPPQPYRLFNTYYDTPGHDLYRHGFALRLRRKGRDEWRMTVKGGDPATSALARRSEWEAATQPGAFDFSIVTDARLRVFLESCRTALCPVFSTRFTRTAWRVERSGTLIEVALDRGRIDAIRMEEGMTQASEPICEVELELIEGSSLDALFDLAIELAAGLPLHPEIQSKAERGYALAGALRVSLAKSGPSPVERGMPPVEAFRQIALDCLRQLQGNERGIVSGQEAEYRHQARIAIRRLRSAFRVFAPALAPAFVDVYAPRWKALGRQLDAACDWDVFLAKTLPSLEKTLPAAEKAGFARLRERAQGLHSVAQKSAAAALSGQEYSRLLLAFTAALFRHTPPTIASGKKNPVDLREFAGRRLQKRLTAILKITENPDRLDDAASRRLRAAFRKLRDTLEFFAPLLPHKRLRHHLEDWTPLQKTSEKLDTLERAMTLFGKLQPEKESIPNEG